MLAPQIEGHEGDPLFELGLAGREYYVTRADELREGTGIDIGLWQGGILRLARDDEEADELKGRVGWQRQHGMLCDWLLADEVQERWPWLAPTEGALGAPRDGAVDPHATVRALLADAARHGARRVRDRAVGLVRNGNRVTGVRGESDTYQAGHVVIAAGAWSGRLEGLPRPLSVEPVRGQMVAVPWPKDVPPAIVFGGHSGYVLHRNGEALIGATMEHVGFDASTTPEARDELLSNTTAYFPALAKEEVLRTWAGLRPVTPDGLPIIGREPRLEGLWYASGHARNGVLLSGITATIIQQQLMGESTIEGLETLRSDRFWEL